MIIDDEAWIREGLCEHIEWEKLGIELVNVFEDGAEALAYLEKDPVDIVLSDIRMPNMTGLELVARLRVSGRVDGGGGAVTVKDLSAIKVIFLSGYGDFQYAQAALRLGAVDYLLKPTEVEEIENALLKAKALCASDRAFLSSMPPDATAPLEEPSSYLIKKALKYIHAHFAEEVHLAEIAGELFVTPNYLSRLFRQETGRSFIDYLSRIRLDKACSLLTEGKLKIYQVGEAVGYPNPRYFSEWFQKNTGMSPGDFRKRQI
ncbi:Helix-turn-helix domain-containing protein [Paenibacillus sp. UNCCL117]|nr:Helix-turn-helix domain-containing protein [Paenibacillus sp. cl123]SFW54602.1 Helix-turn-helix domain-containing protein [Paenibacillus sp. UNCCL117]